MPIQHHYREGIPARIVERAERLMDSGLDLFMARSIFASIALGVFFDDYKSIQAVKDEANKGIIRALNDRGAEGMVFADRTDLGNGHHDSTDFVAVTEREGSRIYIPADFISGELVVRESTDNARLWRI